MSNIYRTISQGKTQRETAEAIYDYLIAHPEDVPGDNLHTTTFLLDGTDTAVRVSELTSSQHDAFPAVANADGIAKGWSPFYSDSVGLGVIFSFNADRAEAVHRLALVVRRTLAYEAKQAARLAAGGRA